MNIRQDQFFYLKDGRIIKNLKELVLALKSMDNSTFSHHVNQNKNDFASWIEAVFKKKKLAGKIRNYKDGLSMAGEIEKNILPLKKTGKAVKKLMKKPVVKVKAKNKRKAIKKIKAGKQAKKVQVQKVRKQRTKNKIKRAIKNKIIKKTQLQSKNPAPIEVEIRPPITAEESKRQELETEIQEILKKEKEIEAHEIEIEKKLGDTKKISSHDFSYGFIAGILVSIIVAFLYYVIKNAGL